MTAHEILSIPLTEIEKAELAEATSDAGGTVLIVRRVLFQLDLLASKLKDSNYWRERHCAESAANATQSQEYWNKWKASELEVEQLALRVAAVQDAHEKAAKSANARRAIGADDGLMRQLEHDELLLRQLATGFAACAIRERVKSLEAELARVSNCPWCGSELERIPTDGGDELGCMSEECPSWGHGVWCYAEYLRNQSVRGMKCPFCDDGITGTDYYGEAMDCHRCDGHGWLSADEVKRVYDVLDSHVGTLMSIGVHAGEGDIEAIKRSLPKAMEY